MPTADTAWPDLLAQVHELNRLYLRSLQARNAAELAECGFPGGVVSLLRAAADAQLDAVAEFPRALFDLKVGPAEPAAAVADPLVGDLGSGFTAGQVLELTIAFCEIGRAHV